MPQPDAQLTAFENERRRLTRLAYRMLGSVTDAEDVLQDAWLRWAGRKEAVDSPSAYLTHIVSRLCLDRMKSARARREAYVGAWLPEPLMSATDPAEEIADDLTLPLMLALERLSPLERAAFLLHDVFDVASKDVAEILGRDAAAIRQLASRARRHVKQSRPRFNVKDAERDKIARAFLAAARDGDIATLQQLLADDVVIQSDGGGRVFAFRNIIQGIDKALRLFAGLARKNIRPPKLMRTMWFDGLPGYVSIDHSGILQTTALDVRDGRIAGIYIVRNPDKLRHIAQALGTVATEQEILSYNVG